MRKGPLYGIRKYCVQCCGDQPKEVRLCPVEDCPLYPLRFGRRPKGFKKSALKAIKERCCDCLEREIKMVKECDSGECSLHPYRLGNNPFLKGKRKSNFTQNSLPEGKRNIQHPFVKNEQKSCNDEGFFGRTLP